MENLASKAIIAISAVGIVDAIYTAQEYTTKNFTCPVSGTFCCICVANSGYTSIFGIPFWAMGLIWFPLLLVLGIVLTKGGTWRIRGEILLPVLMIGNLFTIYLWYLELSIIQKICIYCVSLYILNYALTAIVTYELIS